MVSLDRTGGHYVEFVRGIREGKYQMISFFYRETKPGDGLVSNGLELQNRLPSTRGLERIKQWTGSKSRNVVDSAFQGWEVQKLKQKSKHQNHKC